MGTKRRDGASENSLAAEALAEVACKIGREALARLPCHEAELFTDLLVRKQIEKRRLFELGAEAELECVIKNRITRGVQKIGQDEGIFLRERRFLPLKIKRCGADGECGNDSEEDFPAKARNGIRCGFFNAGVGRNRHNE